MADAQKPEDLPKVQTYKQQYDNPRMTFFLGGSPETSPPPPGDGGSQRATIPLPSDDGGRAAGLTASDSADQSRLGVLGRISPGDVKRSSECLVSAPQSRAGSGSALGKVDSEQSKDSESPRSDEGGEIKYIDEDVDDVSDGESISVKVTFKEDLMSAENENHSQAAGATHSPSKEEIMSKFEEQERSFREEFLPQSVLDLSMKREEELAKSPLPLSSISPPGGEKYVLDRNLHYLIKVMEQVSLLRRQNSKLVKKCFFLEDTRELLQLQNDLLMSKDQNRGRMLFSQKIMNYFDMGMSQSSSMNVQSVSPTKPRWERVPSEGSDIVRSSTPQRGGKLQRSQSDGSLDLVDMDFTISSNSERRTTSIQKTSSREHFISRTDFHKKSRKLQQKWERVKKVFSGKPEIGVKTESTAVSAEQLVRANTKRIPGKQRPPDLQNLPKHGDLLRRPDHTSSDTSPNPQELPDTPNSVQSEPSTVQGVDEEGLMYSDTDINVPVLKRSHSAGSMASDNGNGSRHFTFDDHSLSDQECSIEKILFLRQEGRLDRRRSSPTISVHERDKDFPSFEQARLARSSSAKFVKSSSDVDLKALKPGRHDTAAKAKAAWDRVKDIIHARKDSLKKGKPSAGQSSSDGDISPDAVLFERATFHLDPEDLLIPRSQSASRAGGASVTGGTGPVRVRTMKAGGHPGRRSPGTKQKRKSLAHVILNNSPTDVAALMGITDDFNKRMQEWEEKKRGGLVKANSFSCEMDPPRSFDSNSSTKFSEEFIKKMEQWEQMKGLSSPPKSPDPDKPKEPPAGPIERPVQLDTLPQPHPALHNLSESFSKTVQEWERVKERRAQEGTSPGPEARGRPRTVERSKSRERDRSRHKYEKEIQKIEHKEWKIEREKHKLERMKMKLDMAMESSSGSEGFGDSVTYEHMLKQLHERDVSRAVSTQQTETRVLASQHQEASVLTEDTLHHRSLSTKEYTEVKVQQRERVLSSGVLPAGPGLFEGLEPGDSTPDRSRLTGPLLDRPTARGKGDRDLGQQHSPESVRRLTRQLEDKEEHIKDLQYDIQQLTDRISLMDREHHHKVESFKRQLRVANKMGQYTAQSYQIDSSLRELRNQVDVLIQAQDILVKEKHALEKKHHALSLEHEESRRLLLDQIQTLQERLDERGYIQEPSPRPAVTALCGLVTQAQGQINHLRHTLDNRAQIIKELERHVLTQKVNNRLLEAGLQRQALEIGYLRQQTRKKVIKRSKTFSGHEFCIGQDGNIQLRQDRKLADHSKKYSLSKRPSSPQIGDPPSDVINLDLHSNWLEVINRQLEQEEPSAPRPAATLGTQTVMTLINCPYRTVNIPTTRQKVDRTTQSEEAVLEVASTQTIVVTETSVEAEVEKLDGVVVDSAPEVVPIVASVTDVTIPTVVAKCSVIPKPGILKSHIPRPKGTEQKSALPSPKPRKPLRSESPDTGSAASVDGNGAKNEDDTDSKRHSYQDLLRRDPRPFTLSTWRAASLDVPASKESHMLGYDSMASSTEDAKLAGDRDDNHLSPEGSSVSHLPHSPVIRSKNLRKLKNNENKPTSAAADTRVLKATPPRRFIRHRKNMVERLSMGSMLTGDTDSRLPPMSDVRIRSKSDSAELQAACAVARDNSFKRREEEKIARTGEHISRMQNLLEVRSMAGRSSSRSSSGVRTMISRYEEGTFARGNVFRKSPSPSVPRFSVTSPRRLKTAAELLQDSMDQKEIENKFSTIGTPREKLPSTSSDKENSSSASHPKGPIRQSAVDSGSPITPMRSQIKPTLLALAISLRRDEHGYSDSQELMKPLKDRTNDRPDESTPSHPDDHTTGGESESPPRDSEGPVKPKRVPLATITPPSNKRNVSKPRPKTDQRPVAGTTSVKPESTTSKRDPDHPRHMSNAGSLDSSQSAWSSDREDCQPSSPWLVAKDVYQFESSPVKSPKPSPKPDTERKSRSLAKGRFWSKGPPHLFDRKRTVSPSPARGAISALCMHTMTVSVEDDSTDSLPALTARDTIPPSPGSDPGDKRSRRGKFLDSNWFQKPKGFFKVSKC